MSNEDRIKVWRQRRQTGVLATDPIGTALRLASSRVADLVGAAPCPLDALSRIALDALAAFPNVAERRTVFESLSAGLETGIERHGLSEAAADFWKRRLGLLIRTLENDIRRDVDVFAKSYSPQSLIQQDQRLLAGYRAQTGEEPRRDDAQSAALETVFEGVSAMVGAATMTPVDAVLRLALQGLRAFPDLNPADRRAVFDRISEGVQAGVEEHSLDESVADFWKRRTGLVIRNLERDIRRQVAVLAEGYTCEGLDEADGRLSAGLRGQIRRQRADKVRARRRQATRDDLVHTLVLPPQDEADMPLLRLTLDRLHASQRPMGVHVPKIMTILPLFLLRIQIIQADSKIALLWTFLGPVVIMSIISSLYLINGVHFLLGMDIATFSLTGALPYVMFRGIVFRSSESYFGGKFFFNLEPITPLTMALVNAAFYTFMYIVVLATLITIGHALHLTSLPNNPLGVVACIFGVATLAVSFGLVLASIATKWEFFVRFAPVIERALQMISGVFFVSEQLPEQYRKYVLWWPVTHGLQLLRSCYFTTYKSHDASVTYFLVSIVLFLMTGLIADRLVRSNVSPA